jgi:hypothetical protein
MEEKEALLEQMWKLEMQIAQLNEMLEDTEKPYCIPVPDFGFVEMNDYGEPIAFYLSQTDIPAGTKTFMVKIK